MRRFITMLFLMLIALLGAEDNSFELPQIEPVVLQPYASFDFVKIDESSALTKSRQWEDVYWTLNDSGGENCLFPVSREGKLYRAEWYDETMGGVYIGDAVNIDWESLTADDEGNLYIGACGNNSNLRRDLAIYIVKDPHPLVTGMTRYLQKINFYYPEQATYPPSEEDYNYDCEAIFWAQSRLFLLTKHRSDTNTRLYTFNSMYPERMNPVTLLSSIDIRGMVTAAECNSSGSRLAVLTYDAVWLFEGEVGNWFAGSVKWLPIKAKQCEAICFDDEETLLITNEQKELFELKITQLILVRE